MPATLYHGRRANTPARTFAFKHRGIQATGFSPEVLVSIEHGSIFTEALAGTQLSEGADMEPTRHKLLNDAKEVNEHVIAIRGSMRRLSLVCPADSIVVKDFMTVMPRGNVQHLFSVCADGSRRGRMDGTLCLASWPTSRSLVFRDRETWKRSNPLSLSLGSSIVVRR